MTSPAIDYEPCQDLRNILGCLRVPILHGPKEVGDGESLACGVAFENNRVSGVGVEPEPVAPGGVPRECLSRGCQAQLG